jgi:class 3 adenylate cyclase
MDTEAAPDTRFYIGHVLFIDVVGYSKLLTNEQTRIIRELNEIVQNTEQFRVSEKKHRLIRVATGDGMALVFRDSPESPVRCALEITRTLKNQSEPILVRMGVHSGPVSEVSDVNHRINVAGAGINIAQRVMDCGDAGHILLSKHTAEDLEHHARWRPLLHELGECEVKHGIRLGLVNLHEAEAGNPRLPQKIRHVRRRRAAMSTLLFAAAAAGAVGIVAGSWLGSNGWIHRGSDSRPAEFQQAKNDSPSLPTPSIPTASSTAANISNSPLPTKNLAVALTPPPAPSIALAQKLFAGTWRGKLHSVGPRSEWDSDLELTIDPSETRWSNMSPGSVSRSGRSLIYTRSYRLGTTTNVQVQATLTVSDDGQMARYMTSQISVTGKSRSKTAGTGILQRVD